MVVDTYIHTYVHTRTFIQCLVCLATHYIIFHASNTIVLIRVNRVDRYDCMKKIIQLLYGDKNTSHQRMETTFVALKHNVYFGYITHFDSKRETIRFFSWQTDSLATYIVIHLMYIMIDITIEHFRLEWNGFSVYHILCFCQIVYKSNNIWLENC